MTETLDRAMCALQAALFARSLYADDHPAPRARADEAHAALREALAAADPVTIVAFDDRVIHRDDRLPSSASLVQGLFGRLRDRGVECLTFRAGVTRAEIDALLAALVDLGDAAPPPPSAHVRPGHLGALASGTDDGAAAPATHVAPLREVWSSVWGGRGCDADALSTIVANICYTVGRDGGTLLPLASLKRHDEYTFVHTINVAMLSAALAEATGLRSELVRDITAAALLHDVGKRAIPKSVLGKNGKLSDAELRLMRRHPQEGATILFDTPGVPRLAPIVAFEHHMHADGSGYPHARPGWTLSPASQIVQIADVFDALRTHRPYRAALSLDETLEIMTGKPFSPDLLQVFIDRVVRQVPRTDAPAALRRAA